MSQPTEVPPTVEGSFTSGAPMPSQPAQVPQAGDLRTITVQAENPFAEEGVGAAVRADNLYGACSIEDFCSSGDLRYTHDDAQGWVDYVKKFNAPNFVRRDSAVKIWLYTEPYDNWQGIYGVDAVNAFYHSGHGGMDGNGVFYVPMGGSWKGDKSDCTAVSTDMRFADEYPDRVNYLWWSTCLSLRVLDGHSPIRTWGGVNRGGFRMVFGYETVSWDNPNYGKYFWQEWNSNKKPLSTSWLDAGWRIAHDQAPSAAAWGATADEARNRVFNERYLSRSHVSTSWCWWRWYYASSTAIAARDPQRALPRSFVVARLRPVSVSAPTMRTLAQQFNLDVRPGAEVKATPDGSLAIADGERQMFLDQNGTMLVRLAQPNLANQSQIPLRQARAIAQDAVRRYGLEQNAPLVFDRVRFEVEAGGTDQGSGQRNGPFVTQTTVQYRQVINDLPVLTPDAGTVRVTLDNDGTVTAVESSVRPVEQLSDQPVTTLDPPPPGAERVLAALAGQPRVSSETDYRQLLAQEWGKQLAAQAVRGMMPLGYTTVPGSTEVGYALRDDMAVIVAREAVEVDFGNGFYKRYWLETPIVI